VISEVSQITMTVNVIHHCGMTHQI